MRMARPVRVVLLCICFLLGAAPLGTAPIRAQDAPANPLLEMLGYVPTSPVILGAEISYLDLRALVAARPGAAPITSTEDWLTADQDSEAFGLYMAALLGINAGDNDILQQIRQAGATLALTGFDPFAVERHLTFGAPPANGTILAGQFNTAAMREAFLALGYTVAPDGDSMLMCSSTGCDDGLRQNLRDRNPANVFGGNLGRKEPIFVTPTILINSASNTVVIQSVGLYKGAQEGETGGASGVAGIPDYNALASYLGGQTLLQAYILPAAHVDSPDSLINPRLTPAQRAELLERLRREFQPIPAYSLVGLGHIHSDDEQLVLITLVYDNETDATAAAAVLPARFEAYQSIRARQPFARLIEERGGTFDGAAVVAAGERYLTVLTFRAPLETNEQVDGRLMPSGTLFRLFVASWVVRDLGWLASALPE